jgi:uncharacterized repeat protein (TIGR03803 family)
MRLQSASAMLALALVLLLVVAASQSAQAQTLKVLHSFDGTDGSSPVGTLVQATNGDLYGTTQNGGATGADEGTVFEITPTGKLTLRRNFNGADGQFPSAGLVQDTNGDFYGTTSEGGTSIGNGQCLDINNNDVGCGVVFKLTPSGKLTTLYNFCPDQDCPDGAYPEAALVQATNGDLYGTTETAGGNLDGTVFKITPSGTLTELYSFDYGDGAGPVAALVQDTNGDLYGTTAGGGQGQDGNGTVFKITPSGTLTTFYNFCWNYGCLDGSNPKAALVQATNGDLYGTTTYGGANSCLLNGRNYGCGTVFKITPSGTLTTLYSFCSQSNCTDGKYPLYAGLVQATDGNLYGTTSVGGANTTECEGGGCGTIFKITPTGTLTTVYSFCSLTACADGDEPDAALVQDTNGDLYGTTENGGASGFGTVFSLSVGLGPFVETRLTSGKVGAAVQILGTKLTGATSVTFNGKTATFKVVSSTEITTTVPTGATTGKVKVKTPSGTLTSNVNFRVTK